MEKIKELIGLKRNQIKFINENKNFVISQDILEECGLKSWSLLDSLTHLWDFPQ